uniref:Uncharacterized protein n=1 Tax=Ascaris lumbricoides TaxID=6252 RepID=A0A0M3HVD5_ASCLU
MEQTTTPTLSGGQEQRRARRKWTSAFRVMQSLHRFKHPPLRAHHEFTEGPPRNLHLELLEPSRPPPSDFFERPCGSQPQLYRGQRTSQPQLFDSPRAVLSLEKRVHYLNDSSESRRYLPTQQTVTAFVADKFCSSRRSLSRVAEDN